MVEVAWATQEKTVHDHEAALGDHGPFAPSFDPSWVEVEVGFLMEEVECNSAGVVEAKLPLGVGHLVKIKNA